MGTDHELTFRHLYDVDDHGYPLLYISRRFCDFISRMSIGEKTNAIRIL
jgi:hypothetical protein